MLEVICLDNICRNFLICFVTGLIAESCGLRPQIKYIIFSHFPPLFITEFVSLKTLEFQKSSFKALKVLDFLLKNIEKYYSATTQTKATQTNCHTNYPITIEYLNNRIATNVLYFVKIHIICSVTVQNISRLKKNQLGQ